MAIWMDAVDGIGGFSCLGVRAGRTQYSGAGVTYDEVQEMCSRSFSGFRASYPVTSKPTSITPIRKVSWLSEIPDLHKNTFRCVFV